jgi:hypothetical protein
MVSVSHSMRLRSFPPQSRFHSLESLPKSRRSKEPAHSEFLISSGAVTTPVCRLGKCSGSLDFPPWRSSSRTPQSRRRNRKWLRQAYQENFHGDEVGSIMVSCARKTH